MIRNNDLALNFESSFRTILIILFEIITPNQFATMAGRTRQVCNVADKYFPHQQKRYGFVSLSLQELH